MREELHLLCAFLLEGGEVLAMLSADISQHADGGADDALQAPHLARLGDTRLENAERGTLIHLPNGEGYTYLRVVGLRGASDAIVIF